MYEDMHEPAEAGYTVIADSEFQAVMALPFKRKQALKNDWQRIDQLIFKTSNNKGQNQ